MKSVTRFVILCLLSVVALNYSAQAEENAKATSIEQAIANANQMLANANQSLANANNTMSSILKTSGSQEQNQVRVNEEKQDYKKSEIKGFVGGTFSMSGYTGVKAGLEYHKNLNQHNSVFFGVEGTYYLPNIKNKFYEQDYNEIEQIGLLQKDGLDKPLAAYSEKYSGSLTFGTNLKFGNYFSIAPYLVASVGYGEFSAVTKSTATANFHYVPAIIEERTHYTPWGEYSCLDVIQMESFETKGESFGINISSKNKFLYKGGIGMKFTLGERIFIDARYQISPVNKFDYNATFRGVVDNRQDYYDYEPYIAFHDVDINSYHGTYNYKTKKFNAIIHEVSVSAGIYLF